MLRPHNQHRRPAMSNSKPTSNSNTTLTVVARVQRAVALQNEGRVPKGNYVGRMQHTVAQPAAINGKNT